MGVFTQVYDTPAAVPPTRLFKALILDFHNLFPKLVDNIHNIEFTQGNGGPGTIKKITTIEGEKTKYVLHRVDAIDEGTFVYNFSIIEGSALPETLEKISFQSQLVEGQNGGTIRKVHVQYFTKAEATLSEEDLKANQDKIQDLNSNLGYGPSLDGYADSAITLSSLIFTKFFFVINSASLNFLQFLANVYICVFCISLLLQEIDVFSLRTHSTNKKDRKKEIKLENFHTEK